MSRVTLPEPIQVSSFWKNRSHDAIVTTLSTIENRNIVDVRVHVMKEGRLVPTTRGVAMVILRLPDLHKAITRALAKARELGLLEAEGEAGK